MTTKVFAHIGEWYRCFYDDLTKFSKFLKLKMRNRASIH